MKHPHNREHLPKYLKGIVASKYTQAQVAKLTNYTREHICRLVKRYKKEGAPCLVNGHKGKPGSKRIPQEINDKIVSVYRRDFTACGEGTNFACFRDCLESDYGIKYSYRAVYDILTQAGIESPEKKKKGAPPATKKSRRKRNAPNRRIFL